jgi:hypothetical protein
MSIDFTPHAVYDIDTAAEELECFRAGNGSKFRLDLQQLFDRLERLPESAAEYEPPNSRLPGLRVTQLSKSKRYAVFYQTIPNGILIVRCLHASRNIAAIFDEP